MEASINTLVRFDFPGGKPIHILDPCHATPLWSPNIFSGLTTLGLDDPRYRTFRSVGGIVPDRGGTKCSRFGQPCPDACCGTSEPKSCCTSSPGVTRRCCACFGQCLRPCHCQSQFLRLFHLTKSRRAFIASSPTVVFRTASEDPPSFLFPHDSESDEVEQ
jgi:hypothetical protein